MKRCILILMAIWVFGPAMGIDPSSVAAKPAPPPPDIFITHASPQKFPPPHGWGLRIEYSYDLKIQDAPWRKAVSITTQYSPDGSTWYTDEPARSPQYDWDNIQGNIVCGPAKYNLMSGQLYALRVILNYDDGGVIRERYSNTLSARVDDYAHLCAKYGEGDVYVGSFSVLSYNTYLLNPEGPAGEAPDNDCRGYHIGSRLRELNYDIVALTETFDDKGRHGLWDQINSYCVKEGYKSDNPAGGYSQCKYPAWVLNWPSSSDSECGRYCTETGGLSLLSKNPFVWNSSLSHTQHYKGDNMCGAVDCRAGKGFIRGEIKNLGGMHATNLQVYVTHTQANYHNGDCNVSSLRACGRWYDVRERQLQQMADHSRNRVKEGDGPILYVGDLNIPAHDFDMDTIHPFFRVYDSAYWQREYDQMLGILNGGGTNTEVIDAYREVHPPDPTSSDPDVMLPYFTSNPTWNHLAGEPWHGRIDYQIADDSRSCYRLFPVSAKHIDLQYPSCNTGAGDSLSDHFAVGVTYEVYRKKDGVCNFATDPPVLQPPLAQVLPLGSGMILSWSLPANPGIASYEVQFSEDGGTIWKVYSPDPFIIPGSIYHYGGLPCGEGYQRCLRNSQVYRYRVRALDSFQFPVTNWSNEVSGKSLDWADLRTPGSLVINPGFEAGLTYWEPYGDGNTDAGEGGMGGSHAARLARDRATGNYFGLVQQKIPCEPNTIYRLTLGLKTIAESGVVGAGLGNWGTPDGHQDFGWTGGSTDWKQVCGSWTSGENERTLDIVLYGSPDFSGEAFFDNLVLEKVGMAPLVTSIEGPPILGFKEAGAYVANVVAGSGDYRYQWNQQSDGSAQWYPLGTGKTQTVRMLDRGFTLRVDIHDNRTGQEASAKVHVENGEGGDKI